MLLSIETCFNKCSVCFYSGGKFYEKIDETKNNHTNSLPNFTEEIFQEHGVTVQNLKGIIVNHGPGSFTGIRIGIAFALGLSTPFDIPLYGVSTLEALVLDDSPQEIAIRAIKDTVYFQEFEFGVKKMEARSIEISEIPYCQNLKVVGFESNDVITKVINAKLLTQYETPSAKVLIERFLFKKTEIYTEPLYIRPVNAVIGAIKNIKQ